MFGDRDSHWWFHLDQQTGELWLAGRFGALRLRTAKAPATDGAGQGQPASTVSGAPVDPPVGPA